MGQGASAGSTAAAAAEHNDFSQRQDEEKANWLCRMIARLMGILGGLLAMVLGLWTCITFKSNCLAAGMLQIVIGFLVIALEAPCCCMWFDFIDKIGAWSESRPYYQKAFFYGILGIIPIAMCPRVGTIFGAGMIFMAGAFYGMLALGKKADRETMMARAGQPSNAQDDWDATLVDREKNPNNSIP